MNILLSAHMDLARPVMSIRMDDKNLLGLVDNFAGVFAAYQASRKTGVPVEFTNFEELEFDGAEAVAKKLDKDTLVIVVDTTTEPTDGKEGYIGNLYGIDVVALQETFGSRIRIREDYFEATEDETIIYGKKYGLKTFYYGITIRPHYHDPDNSIALREIDNASRVLVDLISWYKKQRGRMPGHGILML